MEMPDDYIKDFLGFSSIADLIENLYLKSLIEAYPKVLNIPNISILDENHIRDELQKIICFNSGLISKWINKSIITLTVENQIFTKENERKRTDIAFIIPNLKYVIECKKLNGVSKTQYIDKGISRFLKHLYIGENEVYAGMCSFVAKNTTENIIDGTIKRLKQYDFLNIDRTNICNFNDSFSTTHMKINNEEILLHHLFFSIHGN